MRRGRRPPIRAFTDHFKGKKADEIRDSGLWAAVNSHLKWLLKAAVAVTLLGWLLRRADVEALWQLLAGQDALGLLAAMAIVLLGLAVGTSKWRLLLPAEPFVRLLRLNLAASFYALVVPGQVGAEIIKTYQLGRGRIDAERIAASVMLDKITGLLSLLALGGIGALLSSLPSGQALRLTLAGLFAACAAVLLGLRIPTLRQFALTGGERLRAYFPRLDRPVCRFILFVDAWCDYLRRPALLWASLAAGVLQQAIYIALIVLLSRQLGFELPVFEWGWIFALISVATILPISLAGLGVREGAFVGLLGAFAVPAEQALALSLTIFALQVLLGLIGGALELLRVARRR